MMLKELKLEPVLNRKEIVNVTTSMFCFTRIFTEKKVNFSKHNALYNKLCNNIDVLQIYAEQQASCEGQAYSEEDSIALCVTKKWLSTWHR